MFTIASIGWNNLSLHNTVVDCFFSFVLILPFILLNLLILQPSYISEDTLLYVTLFFFKKIMHKAKKTLLDLYLHKERKRKSFVCFARMHDFCTDICREAAS